MAFSWYYETAKESISLASNYITTACTQAVSTAGLLTKKMAAEVPLDSQKSELAQNIMPDPTGKINLNMINRHASLLDEEDEEEWDDAYLRPDIVMEDKARLAIYGLLVENGEWVYLLGSDRK